MRKKYFGEEQMFEHIWKNADHDGIWSGDDATLAEKFHVTEAEAHEILGELCQGGRVQKLYPGKYAIVKWRERDDPGEEELPP